MTDIDLHADIGIDYRDDDLHVRIPLAGQVTQMWCRRYEALARAKEVPVKVFEKRDGPAWIFLTMPTSTEGGDVLTMLDVARALIAEADAVDQSSASSDAPEAIAREWWARQQA
jgi:hypothetical protein